MNFRQGCRRISPQHSQWQADRRIFFRGWRDREDAFVDSDLVLVRCGAVCDVPISNQTKQ